MEKSCPSFFWEGGREGGEGGCCCNGEVSEVCYIWVFLSRVVQTLKHFVERKTQQFYMDEVFQPMQLSSAAETSV